MDKPTNGAKAPGQIAEMGLKAIRVFADLCELLEEYAPSWYSEEVHDRAQRALHLLEDTHGLSQIRTRLVPDTQGLFVAPSPAEERGSFQKTARPAKLRRDSSRNTLAHANRGEQR